MDLGSEDEPLLVLLERGSPLPPATAVRVILRELEDAPEGDVYAMCSALFRLVTGHPSVELHRASVDSPRWLAVPAPLRPLLQRGSSADAATRPSPTELVDALQALEPALSDLPAPPRVGGPPAVAALVATLPQPPRPAIERRRVDRSLLYVGVALIAAVAVLGGVLGPLASEWLLATAP